MGLETTLLHLDAEAHRTGEGFHPGRDGGYHPWGHYAESGTDSRRDAVSQPKTQLLHAWENEGISSSQSALNDDLQIGFLRQTANEDLGKFLRHESTIGG